MKQLLQISAHQVGQTASNVANVLIINCAISKSTVQNGKGINVGNLIKEFYKKNDTSKMKNKSEKIILSHNLNIIITINIYRSRR